MLNQDQRVDRYLIQTGRVWDGDGQPPLTGAQRRRTDHKAGHQLQSAGLARQDKAEAKQAAVAARALRRANPLAR